MVLFCPHCANILLIEVGNTGLRFYCQTCPYVFKITQKIETRLPFTRKRPDDVLGGEEAWANAPKDKVTCPKCGHGEAFYMQIQTRSADEPMTIYYKCCNFSCGFRWKE